MSPAVQEPIYFGNSISIPRNYVQEGAQTMDWEDRHIAQAILSLERLARSPGRPPGSRNKILPFNPDPPRPPVAAMRVPRALYWFGLGCCRETADGLLKSGHYIS